MTRSTLSGRRLTLRPFAAADAPALAEAVSASAAQLKRRFRWMETAADAAAFIAGRGAGENVYGVFEAKDGKLCGVASLDRLDREALRAEASLWIRADAQDRGYALEAGKLLVEHAFRRLALHRLYARIDPTNRAARKVLQRAGFRYEGCLRGEKRLNNRWIDQECWGILKADWKK